MALDPNKLLVIYIPKNGCLCIPWKDLNGTTEENSSVNAVRDVKEKGKGKYDTFLELKSKLDLSLYTPITVVRNPFTRAYSLYNHYFSLTYGGKKLNEFLQIVKKEDKPFVDFLNQIKNNRPFHPNSRGLVPKTQSYFLKNESSQIDQSISIYKQENLEQLRLDLNVNSLVHSNKKRYDVESELNEYCSRYEEDEPGFATRKKLMRKFNLFYSRSEMEQNYTQECIDLVKEIYAEDFDNFNYSRNFADVSN